MKRFILYTKQNTRIEDDYRVYKELPYNNECVYCGDYYKSRSPLAKYCSQRCKNDVAIEKKAKRISEAKKELTKCLVCSSVIKQKKNSKIIKYCSNKCKQTSYRKSLLS